MQVLPEGEENLSIYRKYYLLAESKKYSFAEMRELLYFFNPNRTFEGLFKSILRVKKGLIYTATRGGSYSWLKDKVYLDGYEKINNLNPDQKVLDTLKKAKIKIEDQNFIL